MSTGTRKKGKALPTALTPVTAKARPVSRHQRRGLHGPLQVAIIVGLAIAVLGALFTLNNRGGGDAAGAYPYQVGKPGPGQQAPPIVLPSTDGSTFDLEALRGQTVLLYFQEGVGCQPCWDQLRDIEAQRGAFQALGIERIVTITGDPLGALKQKVANEKLITPVLSDAGLAVSKTYQANQYGMMGNSADGHSFILVDKEGRIMWRADYGGAPKYTMYVPVADLVADRRNGLANAPR